MEFKLYAQAPAERPQLLGTSPTLEGCTPLFAAVLKQREDELEGIEVYVEGPNQELYVETGLHVWLGSAGPFVHDGDPRGYQFEDYCTEPMEHAAPGDAISFMDHVHIVVGILPDGRIEARNPANPDNHYLYMFPETLTEQGAKLGKRRVF